MQRRSSDLIVVACLSFKYLQSRPIDFAITPFQCKLCLFKNGYEIEPSHFNASDRFGLGVILRANLDLSGSESQVLSEIFAVVLSN